MGGVTIFEVLLHGLEHQTMGEDDDTEADDLGHLGPHEADGDHLAKEEEKEELGYLRILMLGYREFVESVELDQTSEKGKK